MTDPGGGKTADGSARWRPSALPLALLFLALATVFLFGGGRGHFYHERGHDHITWNHMTVAENLSPEHDFLGFYYLTLDDDGNRTYVPYNRFPVLGHVGLRPVHPGCPDDRAPFLSPATAARHHHPLAALALSGPCWAVAMRNLYHGFEAMFYVGIPLAIFALMLPRLDRWLGGRVRCGAG